MYERLLDKSIRPNITNMIEWCGESGTLFTELKQFMTEVKNAQNEIRFPYGNGYGWCVTYRKNKKLLCDAFPICGALNVMLRLSDNSFQKAYSSLTQYTQEQIDARYPCGNGGWIHDRITNKEHLDDIMKLLALK